MAILRGIETLGIGARKTVELFYAGKGAYEDSKGDPVAVEDVGCYDCRNGYFVLTSDPIDFCPHCGYRSGKGWPTYEEARTWAMKHDWAWMRALGRQPIGCRRSDGAWQLAFARDPDELLRSGRFAATRALIVDARSVAEGDGTVGQSGGGGKGRGGAFGGGSDGWSGVDASELKPGQASAGARAHGGADDGLEID